MKETTINMILHYMLKAVFVYNFDSGVIFCGENFCGNIFCGYLFFAYGEKNHKRRKN